MALGSPLPPPCPPRSHHPSFRRQPASCWTETRYPTTGKAQTSALGQCPLGSWHCRFPQHPNLPFSPFFFAELSYDNCAYVIGVVSGGSRGPCTHQGLVLGSAGLPERHRLGMGFPGCWQLPWLTAVSPSLLERAARSW